MLYEYYLSTSLTLGDASGTETLYVPKVKAIEIENNQRIGILNETLSKTIKNSSESTVILVDKKGPQTAEMPLYLEIQKNPAKVILNVISPTLQDGMIEVASRFLQ